MRFAPDTAPARVAASTTSPRSDMDPQPSPLVAPTTSTIASPVTAGTLLSRTFGVWKDQLGPFAAVMLAFHIPSLLVQWAVGSPFLAGQGGFGKATPEAQAFLLTWRYWAMMAVAMFVWVIQTAAVTAGALEHLGGRRASFGEMVARGVRRTGPIVVAGALATLAASLGLVLLIVPGIILSLMFSLVVPVVIVERLSPPKVLGRSRALTKGHRWALLTVLAIVYMAAMVPAVVAGAAGAGVPYLSTLLGSVLNTVVGPLLVVAPAVAYHDLRAFKEGAGTVALERVFEKAPA